MSVPAFGLGSLEWVALAYNSCREVPADLRLLRRRELYTWWS